MTRIKSISDIGNLYESIYKQNETSNIIEEKKSGKKFPKGTFPKAGEEVKEPKTLKGSGPENVKGVKKVKKNKKNSRKYVRENINSFMKSKFDKLFENVMDDELDVNMDLGPGAGPEGDVDVDVDSDIETEVGGDEVTITIDKATAQTLIDVLQAAVGGEEDFGGEEDLGGEEDSDLEDLEIDTENSESEDEDEDEEEVDEDEEEEEIEEEIEAEKLSDEHGKKLTHTDNKVPGTLKTTSKGKASSDVTKASDLTELGDKGHVLTKKDNKVHSSIKAGQSFFGNR